MSEDIAKFVDQSNFCRTLNLKNMTLNITKGIYVYEGKDENGHVYKLKKFTAENVSKNEIWSAEREIEERIERYKKGLEG